MPVLPISESAPLGMIPKLLARAHFADMVLLEGAVFNGDYLARFKVAGSSIRGEAEAIERLVARVRDAYAQPEAVLLVEFAAVVRAIGE